MASEFEKNEEKLDRYDSDVAYEEPHISRAKGHRDFLEEHAAEIGVNGVPVVESNRNRDREAVFEEERSDVMGMSGRGLGILGLALSILSLFFLPIIMGAAGIIVGFIARKRGAQGLGAWAIGIGIVSIVVGIFVLPLF
ncbi:DUF308 domain-containing protein [Sutcliffiella rhizosphaerae]|uniref:DUF4190 domain-containing protein n=1 Tax=Sutcliffiella rhizosphaerae TaxID=2880967 RepID=A0ABM8YHL6_9BACI|nr:DUF308 domain-containing protein [Sutcliffiella rhizosphaerae]CAG9619326.1 hypothetical protein BACCIP111883_00093 [Sutcliffiella rhizosphaerae]